MPAILSGDLNVYQIAFDCRSSNFRGHEVYNLVNGNDLCVLDTGSLQRL